jgi:hypothetical protein
VRSFVSSAVLPFDASLRIEIDPEPRDLAGLVVESVPTTAQTMPDPGLLAEDGFESDPVARLGGGTVVTGVGTLPAITGARSLLIRPGGALTMRIPLAVGDTHLRFRGRPLFREPGRSGCSSHGMRAGAPGGSVWPIYPPGGYEPEEVTGDEFWGAAGPIEDVELILPPGLSGDLAFDVYALPLWAPPCPETALLIDDLRAE